MQTNLLSKRILGYLLLITAAFFTAGAFPLSMFAFAMFASGFGSPDFIGLIIVLIAIGTPLALLFFAFRMLKRGGLGIFSRVLMAILFVAITIFLYVTPASLSIYMNILDVMLSIVP